MTSATLIGGYHAVGYQTYSCIVNPDAGADAADAAETGLWVNSAQAVLIGDNCAKVADNYAKSLWHATDGSNLEALIDDAVDPPGDGGAVTAIKWARLKAVSSYGEGIFGNVTWVQRINTTGGLQPSATCDPTGPVAVVPYTADYFFYSGGTSNEAGADSGS